MTAYYNENDPGACTGGDLANTNKDATGRNTGVVSRPETEIVRREESETHRPKLRGAESDFDWAIGADGKARRVKPGVRLLVDGFPARVGLLRGFGNAIDPRPAEAFIRAALAR